MDVELFDRHVTRLAQLGYCTGRCPASADVAAGPDAAAPRRPGPDRAEHRRSRRAPRRGRGVHRPAALGAAARVLRPTPRRPGRPSWIRPGPTSPLRSPGCTPRTCCCSTSARSTGPPRAGSTRAPGSQRLAPPGTPPRIRAVVERYLRLHLDANLDRPQTVRHARDALRRLVELARRRPTRRSPTSTSCTASTPRSSCAGSAPRPASTPARRWP